MVDKFRRDSIIEDLAAMTEAEFLDTVAKARGGGRNNPESKKQQAAQAMRQFLGATPTDSKE